MLNKTTLLSILLGSTFISSPAMATYNMPSEYGEGNQAIYYKWETTDGQTKLVKTNEAASADITFKYGKENYSGTVKNIRQSKTLYDKKSHNIYSKAVDNSEQNNIDSISDVLFDSNSSMIETSNGTYAYIYGGAINNKGSIGDIIADFNNNFVSGIRYSSAVASSFGGAISNDGTIKNIEGTFNNNVAASICGSNSNCYSSNAAGGAINNSGIIENIKSNFINNLATGSTQAYGGAIYNLGTITNLSGNFINNNSTHWGGAIFIDAGKINNITGDFIGNYTLNSSDSVVGGAILNYGTIGKITSNFIGNYAQSSSGIAKGGAIYSLYSSMNAVNSSFINNYAKSETGTAQGGAIYSSSNINITADKGESLFSGNYVESDGVKTSNAIYMSGADLKLSSVNNGTITFDDGIDGNAYGIVVNGDGSGIVKFNNSVDNVKTFTMNDGSFVHLGLNGVINTETLTTSSSTSISANALNNPTIKVDIEVDKANSKVNSGLINVSGDVIGSYNVIVNALNPEVFDNASVAFLKAPNDDASTASSFNIARVIGSPYMWDGDIKTDAGSIWYLNLTNTPNSDGNNSNEPTTPDNPTNPVTPTKPSKTAVRTVTPEVIAGIGLHEAAIEQTRSVVRNVSGKAASGREYCPGCGIYPASWDSKALRNVWVTAQGESANIDKPADMDAKIWGVEGGFDMQNDVNNTLGVFASYRKGDYDLSGKGSKYYSKLGSEIDIDSYLAGLYYRYDKNMNWLFATVYGGVQQADVKTDDGMSKFDSDGVEFGAGVEGGHSFALNKSLTLDPSLGVYYTQINFDKAHDNVGKSYKWDDIKHVEAEAAVKLSQQFENAKVYVKPSLIQTYTDGDSVRISGLNKADTYHDQTLGRIEIGGNYGFTDSLNGYVWSNYTYGSSYDSIAAGLGINYAW